MFTDDLAGGIIQYKTKIHFISQQLLQICISSTLLFLLKCLKYFFAEQKQHWEMKGLAELSLKSLRSSKDALEYIA